MTEFKRKGHQEQYKFNKAVKDCLKAAAKEIKRLIPGSPDDNYKKLLEEALDELQEGQEVEILKEQN